MFIYGTCARQCTALIYLPLGRTRQQFFCISASSWGTKIVSFRAVCLARLSTFLYKLQMRKKLIFFHPSLDDLFRSKALYLTCRLTNKPNPLSSLSLTQLLSQAMLFQSFSFVQSCAFSKVPLFAQALLVCAVFRTQETSAMPKIFNEVFRVHFLKAFPYLAVKLQSLCSD